MTAEVGELRAAWLVLQRSWWSVRRRWPQLLIVAGLAAAGVLLRLALRPDRYVARGLLQVGLNLDAGAGNDYGSPGTATRAFYSQVELISSERVLTEAMFGTQGGTIPPGRARDEALAEFLEHVTIRPVRNTFLVEVEAWDPVPKQAARRVEVLFEVYLAVSNSFIRERYRVENEQAHRREQDALQALQEADARRQAFLAEYGDVSLAARGNALTVRSGELEERAARADVQLATIAAEASVVALNLAQPHEEPPEVMLGRLGFLLQAKELTQPLRQARSDLARAESALEPEHPLLTLLRGQERAEVDALRAALRSLSLGRQEDLRCRALELARERLEVQRLREELERERFSIGELQTRHQRLEREVAHREKELEATRDSQWRTEGLARMELAAAVLAPAEVPSEPTSPFTPLVLAGIVLGCLALGATVVVVWDHLDDTLRADDDLEASDGLPVLARIPVLSPHDDERSVLEAVGSDGRPTGLGEAFRLLRTNALHALGSPERLTLLVSSAMPGEGKTVSAACLAAVLARTDGPVLLVEGDLRRPRLAGLFGLEGQLGLTQVLLGECQLAAAAVPTAIPGLSLLPAGRTPSLNPSDLLTAGTLARVLEEARASYRVVLIDGPPVLGLADASLLAARGNGVLFVVRMGRTRRRELRASQAQLLAVDARVIGLVVTGHSETDTYLPYA